VTTRITQACSVTTSGAEIDAIQIRCESSSMLFNSMEISQYWLFTNSIYTMCPLNGGLLCRTVFMKVLNRRKNFCPGRESVHSYNSSRSVHSHNSSRSLKKQQR